MIPASSHCLLCGYLRIGLARDALCPECGGRLPGDDEVVLLVRLASTGRGLMRRAEIALAAGIVLVLTSCIAVGVHSLVTGRATVSPETGVALVFVAVCSALLPSLVDHVLSWMPSMRQLQVWITPRGYAVRRGWGRVKLRPWPIECIVRCEQVNDSAARVIVERFQPYSGTARNVLGFEYQGPSDAVGEVVSWVRRCCKAA